VKVMIGGPPVSPEYAKKIGADSTQKMHLTQQELHSKQLEARQVESNT
jgi:hypothetical protein